MASPIESFEWSSPKAIPFSSRVRIPRPEGCSLVECPALSNYERELERREAIEYSMSKALAREDELLRRNKMLSAEFEHRMLNNIQMVASILNVQSRSARVAMGRIQRRLHTSQPDSTIELKSYLEALGGDIAQMTRGCESTILVEGDVVAISPSTCATLGLIVNELVTNALKHAAGNINLRVEQLEDNMCRVSVTDEGPGLPPDFLTRTGTGMGRKIIESLAKQIDGRIEIDAGYEGGAKIDVLFLRKSADV